MKDSEKTGTADSALAALRREEPAYSLLSCDIFDTALRRVLARPEDIFLAAGTRAFAEGLIACSPGAFAVYRQTAERRARAVAESCGHDEVRIAEIYAELSATGVVSDPVRAARIEFEAECAVCVPIMPIREMVLARLAARTDSVIFASDTCLPGAWLAELLAVCGYPEGCRVFASSDLRLGKHTGRMFPAILAALGHAPGDVLHIGDNPVSDVVRPQSHGIRARHLGRPRPAPEENSARHFVVRLEDSRQRMIAAEQSLDPPLPGPALDGRMLAAHAAPLVIGFAQFILSEAEKRGVRRIYFLSRDGYLPLAIIRRILDRQAGRGGHELYYLHVSRLAMGDGDAARTYLEQSGFSRPGPRLIVDLGWRGSTQVDLARLCGIPEEHLVGCYVGLWADALRPEINVRNAAGYLFSHGHPQARADCVREAYILLELVFSAPHGTVLRYDIAGDGNAQPVLQVESGPESEIRRAAFTALESACLETFDALAAIAGGGALPDIDADSALSTLEALLLRPSCADVARINRIPFIHYDDDPALFPAVNPLPLHEAIRKPRQSLKRLGNAPWRAGAVRAALPWPVPMMSYDVLRQRAERVLAWADRIRRLPGRTR